MAFNPSKQQQDIFDFISGGEGNAIVDAKAGSGKTTTIVEGMKHIKYDLVMPDVTFLAFNKSIADTLSQRCPRGVQCSTFHSLGFRALKASGILEPRVKVDGRKIWKLLWNVTDRDDPDQRNIARLVGLLKSTVHPPSYEQIDPRDLIEYHNIDFEKPAQSIHIALMVLEASTKQLDVIDFDDMLYLAVVLNARFEPKDWVFVDEAQDTNDIQLEILSRLQKYPTLHMSKETNQVSEISSSRLIAVGDPHQAIYGFRGANSDSMQRIAKRFSCKTLPLSVSYRCPKATVREAQRFLCQEE
jgi:DNA helicase-2/ATP-dependent DNA helicase PcrA